MTILDCEGCGATKPAPDGTPTDLHPALRCSNCPPWHCERCERTVDMAAQLDCNTCVMRFEGMPLADIKAVFARDGSFNVGGL